MRLRLLLRILLVILVEFLGHFIDKALIMFSMLQIAFRQHAISGGSRIPRQSHIFFIDLVGCAANTHLGAVAVKGLDTRIDAPAALLPAIMVVSAPAAIAAIIASTATTATAHTPCVLIMSHAVFFFTSVDINAPTPNPAIAGT